MNFSHEYLDTKIIIMSKKLILFASAILTTFATAVAQDTLPNPGFEDWTNGGGFLNPDGWGTINHLIPTVSRTNAAGEVHSGTYAAKLSSVAVGPNIAPGICVTGQVNIATSGVDGGIAYNLRPVSMTGWFMYSPGTGDTASVEVTLTKWNAQDSTTEVVGYTRQIFTQSVTSYQQFTDSIDYSSTDAPDTAVIVLLSSAGANGVAGSTLFIDDLAFGFDNTGVENHFAGLRIGVGPNPAQNTLYISNLKTEATFELFDITGRKAGVFQVSENKRDVNIAQFANGVYVYRISDEKQSMLSTGKLIVRR